MLLAVSMAFISNSMNVEACFVWLCFERYLSYPGKVWCSSAGLYGQISLKAKDQ